MVELEVVWGGGIYFEAAFAVVTFPGADEHGVLKFEGIRGKLVGFASELPGFCG